jgi:hypothetical protein
MTGQTERSERITTVKLTSQVEDQVRQEYRCAWMPENIWGTVSVQPTDNGFTVEGDYYRQDRKRRDRYALYPDGSLVLLNPEFVR